ncbi:GNAT family N-acetyltransferase [Christensenella tenuis]|uniref:GNAT family N-acetyltransferase n=1 Tax=Christensenella tenuis TaxID=2763033 RepID=A0ABR7EGX7_9FIRM|nr:GNAT family N-acetyltransferase [Christensenella tenuis]MBC5648418.1 GNAT family N-acetyltransferase [Christensenella tenuis]
MNEAILFETERMAFRRFTMEDRETVNVFLRDPEVMYAWEHGFSEDEVTEWLEKNLGRYAQYGYSWLCADDRKTGENIGAIGLIYNEDINGEACWEIGYIVNKKFWGMGYAAEGARGCVRHAFDVIGTGRVISQMRTNNASSRAVAQKIGMKYVATYDRIHHGKKEPHDIYVIEKRQGG